MAILKLPVVIDGVKSIEELANRVLDEYEYHGRTIREWADLISEIPSHGRLIDADALKDKWTNKDLDLFSQGWGWLRDLNQAPTIIPADPAEEEET